MTLTIEVKCKPGKANELYQTLQALLPTMRKEKGCLNCRVSRDTEDGEVFLYYSDWDSQLSLETYIRSGSGSAMLGAIDLLAESSRIRMGSEARWEAIETLKRMRREA